MTEATIPQANEPGIESQCRHHWLIESPHGATSLGICKLCGAQKEFRNSASDWLWEAEPLSELTYGRWGKSKELLAPTDEPGDEEILAASAGGPGGARLG